MFTASKRAPAKPVNRLDFVNAACRAVLSVEPAGRRRPPCTGVGNFINAPPWKSKAFPPPCNGVAIREVIILSITMNYRHPNAPPLGDASAIISASQTEARRPTGARFGGEGGIRGDGGRGGDGLGR